MQTCCWPLDPEDHVVEQDGPIVDDTETSTLLGGVDVVSKIKEWINENRVKTTVGDFLLQHTDPFG